MKLSVERKKGDFAKAFPFGEGAEFTRRMRFLDEIRYFSKNPITYHNLIRQLRCQLPQRGRLWRELLFIFLHAFFKNFYRICVKKQYPKQTARTANGSFGTFLDTRKVR